MKNQNNITEFNGEYHFLSNFYESPIVYNGIKYRNAEAAFQAQKQPERAHEFSPLPPNEAKRLGRRVKLRADWDHVKIGIMRDIVTAKFERNPYLKDRLLATGDATLIEGNWWNDRFWGVCNGEGRNELGKILMELRTKLKGRS
ncbi:NADAR family protein [Evansella clarkii]|uniref:NADAR family protein n=1 Tax=Evansella clarkii TaxID=79879 RepID=UPI0009980A46|nr:NADAR family protein [Evansella clarkii]